LDIRLEHTDGLGRAAEVWIKGHLLKVCDGISPADNPCAPGLLEDVQFAYASVEGITWDQAVLGNTGRHRTLDPVNGWSYLGLGRVTQIMPVRVDFGIVEMEDANWTTDESLVGRFVRIPIDRLEIVPLAEPDWPDQMS
jgi:hypothetical protein